MKKKDNAVKINYLEIPVKNIIDTKNFFKKVFNWEFVDYGKEYTCFINGGIDGGFYLSKKHFNVHFGAPLIVFYCEDLKSLIEKVKTAGGEIYREIFDFPGGKRFHFLDVNGNEYAVWSDK